MNNFCPEVGRRRVLSKLREDASNNPNAIILCLMKTTLSSQLLISSSELFFKQFKVSWEFPSYVLNTACLFTECKFQ